MQMDTVIQTYIFHQDHKFVTTDTADDIGCPELFFQKSGKYFQYLVTGCMSISIIDLLEIIHIDHH